MKTGFTLTGGRVVRRVRRPHVCSGLVAANGPLGRACNVRIVKCFGSRTSVRGDPGRSFNSMGPNSVGCGSIGNSGVVSTGSGITVKRDAATPRVCCSFGLKTR